MGVTLDDIRAAADRLDDEAIVRETPVERSRSLSDRIGGEVVLKMEHLQRTGSFKTRGAYNKLQRLDSSDSVIDRVVAASAGNHAQGVALAATKTGLESVVVMPETAPQAKINATNDYGADVRLHGRDFQAALSHARSLLTDGDEFVHAYDDPDIVAGQGTLGLEILDQVPGVDTVVVPIGGGGLIGGVGTAVGELDADVRVVGVQADGAATVPESLAKGQPQARETVRTIADGIATGGLSDLTFELIERYVDEVVVVDDTDIARSMLFLLERTKQLVEGAGAASVAALLSGAVDVDAGETVVPLLCGGNLSMTTLQSALTHALSDRDQLVHLQVRIEDEPGVMSEISGIIGSYGANIRTVRHERGKKSLAVGEAYLHFEIETSGSEHTRRLVDDVRDAGYEVEIRVD
jgi:threonine dehydratase